jgi:hypothetical protein
MIRASSALFYRIRPGGSLTDALIESISAEAVTRAPTHM